MQAVRWEEQRRARRQQVQRRQRGQRRSSCFVRLFSRRPSPQLEGVSGYQGRKGWEARLTELVADPGAGSDTTDTGGRQHGSRVALVLLVLLVLVLALLAVGIAVACTWGVWVAVAGWVASMALVVRGTEEAALVVVSPLAVGRAWGTAGRWCVRALGWRGVCGRLPLGTTGGLVYIIPFLAVLIELSDPTWGHWWRCTVLEHG